MEKTVSGSIKACWDRGASEARATSDHHLQSATEWGEATHPFLTFCRLFQLILLILFSFLGSCFHRPLDQQLWFFPISCTSPSFLVLISVVALLVLHQCYTFTAASFRQKILPPTTTMEHQREFEIWNSMLQVVKHGYSCALEHSLLYHGKNGNHPKEDFGKFGYKPEMKYNSLINLLYLWLQAENYNGLCRVIWINCALLINTATTFFSPGKIQN